MDGQRIVFSSVRDGNTDMYVMRSDGSEVIKLTNDTGAVLPSWTTPNLRRVGLISRDDPLTGYL